MEYKKYDDQSSESQSYSIDDQQESGSETQSYTRPMSAMPGEIQEWMYDEDSEQQSE